MKGFRLVSCLLNVIFSISDHMDEVEIKVQSP
jgi:hypothetical protein